MRLPLNFFETPVDIHVQSRSDLEHLAFYYRDHVRTPSVPASIQVELNSEGSSFVADLSDPTVRKSTVVRYQGIEELSEEFFGRSTRMTPIPPFDSTPLRNRFQVFHGAVAGSPFNPNECVVIGGESGAGKSTLLVALALRGFTVITDDVIALEVATNTIWPFGRPLGMRDAMLEWLPSELADRRQEYGRRLPRPHVNTMVTHATDLGFTFASMPSTPVVRVRLVWSRNFTVDRPETRCLFANWLPERDAEQLAAIIEHEVAKAS